MWIVLRDFRKSNHIRTQYEQQAHRLSFIGNQDMTKSGAFGGSLEGIDQVIHVASPFVVNAKNNRTEVIDPEIRMTKICSWQPATYLQ